MRITGQTPLGGVQGRGAKKRTGSGSDSFSLEVSEETSQSATTSGTGGVYGSDALLSLQEIEDQPPERRRSQAAQRGYDILDTLDQLKADLLAGRISEERLEILAERLAQEADTEDEKIAEVVREIELRAKVELAKLGRFYD